jgi:Na+/proline symporter
MSSTFSWADYLVLGLFLGFSTVLGLVIGYRDRKKATSSQFLMGGGDMHYIPVALSIQASFLSAISILTTPTEIYNFGTMYSYLAVSYFVGIPIAAHMYLPTFHRLRLTSAYEVII